MRTFKVAIPLNPELLKSGIMSRINEDLVDFESPNFNIFKLEEKVGRDNILPVTSMMNLYTDYYDYTSGIYIHNTKYNNVIFISFLY